LSTRLRASATTETSWTARLVFLLLGALLLLAPLLRGGNRQVALSGLLVLGLAALALMLGQASQYGAERWGGRTAQAAQATQPAWWWALVGLLATSPLWLGVLQLTPVPASWWLALPGRAVYGPALQAAGVEWPAALPLSLQPQATWAALWSGVPMVAAFVAPLWLPRGPLDKLMAALLLAGALQVVLAVAQFASGANSPLYFGLLGQGFVGSFANRNHLADFLAMLVPVWFYAWLRLQRQHVGAAAPGGGGRGAASAGPLLLLLGFAFLVVILSTQSRGGILATGAVLLLSALLYGRSLGQRLSRRRRWALVALFLLFGVLVLASIDLRSLLQRVEHGRLQSDAELRDMLALATLDAARAFWPWGSGAGTFESVFPRFQPVLALDRNYVNQAHNDYVQLLMELGALALLLAGALLVLVGYQLRALVRALRASRRRLGSDLARRCYAGLGALALLLHSWVEYNLHIPALAITAAFRAGVFLRPLSRD